MSRSRKRTPIGGITCSKSDKPYKKIEHSRARAIQRNALAAGAEDSLHHKQTGSPWLSPKDGKQWWRTKDPKKLAKWLRK